MIQTYKFRFFLAAVLIGGLCMAPVHQAQAIKLTAKRIVFDRKNRSESLVLINDSNQEKTFRIQWIEKRMKQDGKVRQVDEGDPIDDLRPAGQMIRVAPRRITIPAQGYQTIRLMARIPGDAAPGEYRSHLNITPEPSAIKPSTEAETEGEASFNIHMIVGISLPVFLRVGEMTGTAQIVDASAKPTASGYDLDFSVLRDGNQSIFGDLDMVCMKADGEEVVLKQVRGIAIYTEINRRDFSFPLEMPEGQAGPCSTVDVRYVERDDNGTFKNLIAQTSAPGR